MYVRVQIEQGVDPDALAVPQQAVRHNDTGGSEVLVVREDNRDDIARVRLGRAIGDRSLILGRRRGEPQTMERRRKRGTRPAALGRCKSERLNALSVGFYCRVGVGAH